MPPRWSCRVVFDEPFREVGYMSDSKTKVLVVPSLQASPIPKSKVKIFTALRAIAKEKPFDKISVREICDTAGVAKSTFYSNFQDKYAVIHWHYDMVMGAGVNKIGRTLSWEEGHLITSFGFAAEVPLYNLARKSTDQNGLLPYGIRNREAVLIETLTQYRHVELTDKLRFQITAVAAAEQAVVQRYLNSAKPIDVLAYVDNMIDIIPKELFDAMQLEDNGAGHLFKNPWEGIFL